MTPTLAIEVLAGASLDIDCTCTDKDGPVDVSGAAITFEVVQRSPVTLQPTAVEVFKRRNAAAGGSATEVVQPAPGGGANTFQVKVIPTNTAGRGQYRYRARVEWPAAVPPVARIWEGDFAVL